MVRGDEETAIPRYPTVVNIPPAMSTGLRPLLSDIIPAGTDATAAASILAERIVPKIVSSNPKDKM
jgi:hypothetical protein